jgi:hypothetical protein
VCTRPFSPRREGPGDEAKIVYTVLDPDYARCA